MTNVRLRGRSFRVRRRLLRDADGQCDHVARRIDIAERLRGQQELDTVIHEGLHACITDMSEEAVTETASGIAAWLWAEGWRKVDL